MDNAWRELSVKEEEAKARTAEAQASAAQSLNKGAWAKVAGAMLGHSVVWATAAIWITYIIAVLRK